MVTTSLHHLIISGANHPSDITPRIHEALAAKTVFAPFRGECTVSSTTVRRHQFHRHIHGALVCIMINHECPVDSVVMKVSKSKYCTPVFSLSISISPFFGFSASDSMPRSCEPVHCHVPRASSSARISSKSSLANNGSLIVDRSSVCSNLLPCTVLRNLHPCPNMFHKRCELKGRMVDR